MPLVTLTLRRPVEPAVKRAMLDAVHHALVASGVPPADRFQRVVDGIEHRTLDRGLDGTTQRQRDEGHGA
ncbi:MAG: hypothetical protein ACHQJ7_06550, partial [Vicinamibacteria bacterium]